MRGRIALVRLTGLPLLSGGLGLFTACAELPPREPDVCGNGIFEPHVSEDCDGTEHCIPANTPHACMISCADADCPEGLACGLDQVCRRPGYRFERGATFGDGPVVWVGVHDLDGDGRQDILTIEQNDDALSGRLTVRYLDETGTVVDSWSDPAVSSIPRIADIDGDGLTDLLIVAGDMQWQQNGALIPIIKGVQPLLNDGQRGFVRHLGAHGWAPRPADIVLAPQAGVAIYDGQAVRLPVGDPGAQGSNVFLGADPTNDAPLTPPGAYPSLLWAGDPDAFRGVFRGATFDYSVYDIPLGLCGMRAAYVGGETEVGMFDAVSWPGPITVVGGCTKIEQHLPLPASTRTPGSLAFVEVNGDGNLDLVVTAGDDQATRLWVSYGVADGSFHSDLNTLPDVDGDLEFAPQPLADVPLSFAFGPFLGVGDLNGDGKPDFAFEHAVTLSSSCGANCLCGIGYDCIEVDPSLAAPWRSAAFVDLQADGREELVVSPLAAPFETHDGAIVRWSNDQLVGTLIDVETSLHDTDVVAGDFDADGFEDAALRVEREGPEDELLILWGGSVNNRPEPLVSGVELGRGLSSVPETNRGGHHLMALVESVETPGHSGILMTAPTRRARVVSPMRLPGWTPIDHAVVGRFSDEEILEVAAFSALEGEQPDTPMQGQVWSLRPLLDGGAGRAQSGLFAWLPVPPNRDAIQWMAPSLLLAADFDGDGLDEVLSLGPKPTLGNGEEQAPENDPPPHLEPTLPLALEVVEGAWQSTTLPQVEDYGIAGVWPYSAEYSTAELVDANGDGESEVFAIGWRRATEKRVAIVLDPSSGSVTAITDGDEDMPNLRSWSFYGQPSNPTDRFFAVDGSTAQIGSVDLAEGGFEVFETLEVGDDVRASAAGDVDGDGLVDVVLATDEGVVIYRALADVGVSE